MKTHVERIEIAESLLSFPANVPSADPRGMQAVGGAQAQALLAIAEQLRISNLIAVASFNKDAGLANEARGMEITNEEARYLSRLLEQIRIALDVPKMGDPE